MNAVDETLLDDFDAAIDALEDDPDVTTVVITGAGAKAFCAGADIQETAEGVDTFDAVAFSRKVRRRLRSFERSQCRSWPASTGFASAAGCRLATCADLCIASEISGSGQPEHNLGSLQGWAGPYV